MVFFPEMIYIICDYPDEYNDFIWLRELCVLRALPLGPLLLQTHADRMYGGSLLLQDFTDAFVIEHNFKKDHHMLYRVSVW